MTRHQRTLSRISMNLMDHNDPMDFKDFNEICVLPKLNTSMVSFKPMNLRGRYTTNMFDKKNLLTMESKHEKEIQQDSSSVAVI
jgi:hypothetical protein